MFLCAKNLYMIYFFIERSSKIQIARRFPPAQIPARRANRFTYMSKMYMYLNKLYSVRFKFIYVGLSDLKRVCAFLGDFFQSKPLPGDGKNGEN